jgi:hypothetical protein
MAAVRRTNANARMAGRARNDQPNGCRGELRRQPPEAVAEVVSAGWSGLGILSYEHTLNANRSPTLANRSLLSAPGNGFQEAEMGGAETRNHAPPRRQRLKPSETAALNL